MSHALESRTSSASLHLSRSPDSSTSTLALTTTANSSITTFGFGSTDSSTTTVNDIRECSSSNASSTASPTPSSPFFSHPRFKRWQQVSSARKGMHFALDPLKPFPLVGTRGKVDASMVREAEERRREQYILELREATLLEVGEELFNYVQRPKPPPPLDPDKHHVSSNDDPKSATTEVCEPMYTLIEVLRNDLKTIEEEEEKKELRTQHRNFSLFMTPGSTIRCECVSGSELSLELVEEASRSTRSSWATTNGRGIYTLRNSRFSNLSVLSSIIAPGTPRLEISRTREKCDLEGNPVETPPLVWDRFFGDFWRAASPARQLARASRGSEVARPISLIYERPASPTIRNQPPIPVYQARPPPAPPAIEWIPTVIDPESERGHLPESPPPTPVESARGSQKIIATPKKSLDEVGFITTQDIIKNNRNRIHRDERGFFQLPSPPASPAPPANRASGPSRGTSGPPETFSEMDVILQTDEEHRKSSNSIQGPVKRLFRSRTRKATSKENRRPSLGSSPGEHQGRNRVGSLGTVEERSSYETDQDEMQSRESINTVSSTGDDPQHRKPISKKGRKWRSGGHALMERAKKLSWGKGLGSLSKRHK